MAKFTALDISKVTNIDVTEEQIAIIESDLTPSVVIAGAGSGKTETMANRVVYLIANGIVKPEEILGLTFTKKAASELKKRIRRRLIQLKEARLIAAEVSTDVAVMTYHAYAGSLISEYGLRIGIDGDVQLVGEAQLWQQANHLIRNWPQDDFTYSNKLSTLIDDVMGLTKNILEHNVDPNDLRVGHEKLLSKLADLTPARKKDADEIATVQKVLNQRIKILDLVLEFIKLRQDGGTLSFDDQMSLAARLAEEVEKVGEIERTKYRVVMLDEYQDTSQSQVRMLRALFGKGHPVTAVGDPYQAIYSWRGAATGTIKNFSRDFECEKREFTLSMTFRNDLKILEIANKFAQEVGQRINFEVKPLVPREGAKPGEVVSGVFDEAEAEAKEIAKFLAPIYRGSESAVLVRNRKQIPEIERALREAQIEVEVVGIGGLMSIPEVLDIFTLLKVISDPDAGPELMRHLTGPRLKLGVKDIAALGNFKKSRTIKAEKNLVSQLATGVVETTDADDIESSSLIEALDDIREANKSDFSAAGYSRLLQFSQELRELRARAAGSLIDLIYEIEEYLHLTAELENLGGRRHIDRFVEEAAKFGSNSLSEFITWIEVAIKQERGLEAGTAEVKKDVVQILTIHMAKGLEWENVVIPGVSQGQFPSINNKKSISWLHSEEEIPFDLRGDNSELPNFDLVSITDERAAAERIKDFKSACAQHRLNEEWRLAYVAITRAKHRLFVSFPIWSERKKPDDPSEFMNLIHEKPIAPPDLSKGNLALNKVKPVLWPIEPKFDYSKATEIFASVKAEALDEDAALLIKQRKLAPSQVKLPPRISVSTLVALKSDPQSVLSAIRRPMPALQDRFMRRGTDFHAWVEKHLKTNTLFSDEDLDYRDKFETDLKLTQLQEKWLKSEWVEKTPFDLEVPFETVIAGTLVRGRIDAIYRNNERFEVVDWKTGSTKLGEADAVQLAIYRLAWAKISNTDITNISAAFHYVPTGETDRRSDLLSEQELIDLIAPHR